MKIENPNGDWGPFLSVPIVHAKKQINVVEHDDKLEKMVGSKKKAKKLKIRNAKEWTLT